MSIAAWNDLEFVLAEAQRLAIAYADRVREMPVAEAATPDAVRGRLAEYTFDAPVAPATLLADVADLLERWSVHVTHPRYFGLFNPSVIPVSAAGELMAAVYNPQLAAWAHAAAPNEIERHTLRFLANAIGLPDTAAGNFTSGGQESNLTAVVLALTAACPEFDRGGLAAFDRRPVIYLSEDAHHSFDKIAHITGIGRDGIRRVPVGKALRLDPGPLASAIDDDARRGFAPVMAVGTAGTTSAGTVDPLAAIAEVCAARSLWFHVDAAWGGTAVFSSRGSCLTGIEAADSVTWDAHKWLSVPLGAGMFFCRHAEVMSRAFGVGQASYVPESPQSVVDPYTTTVQWTRRFIGLKVFLALAALGRSGYTTLIDRQCAVGDYLRAALRRASWTIVNDTPLPVVCFVKPGLDPPSLSAVLDLVLRGGAVWLSEVQLPVLGRALRACITSYETTEDDVDRLVGELERATAVMGG